MRSFEVTYTENWVEKMLDYEVANTHKEVSERLPLKSKRVLNPRFREIETTGKYYRITECIKGGKAFIFEVTN